jgi:hypothetical protein
MVLAPKHPGGPPRGGGYPPPGGGTPPLFWGPGGHFLIKSDLGRRFSCFYDISPINTKIDLAPWLALLEAVLF